MSLLALAVTVAQAFGPQPDTRMGGESCRGVRLGLSPDGSVVLAVEDGAVRWKPFGAPDELARWRSRHAPEDVLARGDLGRAVFVGPRDIAVQFAYETAPGPIEFARSIDRETLTHWRIALAPDGEARFERSAGLAPAGYGPSPVGSQIPQEPAFAPWRALEPSHRPRAGLNGDVVEIVDTLSAQDADGRSRVLIEDPRGVWPMVVHPVQGGALVTAFDGADTRGLLRIAPADGALAVADTLRRPDADVSAVAVSPGGTPLWAEFATPIPHYEALSPAGADILQALASLDGPHRYHLLGADMQGRRALVHVSDLHHGRVMEIDTGTGLVRETVSCAGAPSSTRRTFALAFEGLGEGAAIDALHSRTPDRDSLLVHIPGGPHLVWGLALDGAAVMADERGMDFLQLSYPGALGRGQAHREAGRLTQHLVARHQCDAIETVRREHGYASVVVLGASYGGVLAAMMAQSGCPAVDGYALLAASYDPLSDGADGRMRAAFGDPGDGAVAAYWARFAPLRNPAHIEAPLIIWHGRADTLGRAELAAAFARRQAEAGVDALLCLTERGHSDITYAEAVELFDRLAAMPTGGWDRPRAVCGAP